MSSTPHTAGSDAPFVHRIAVGDAAAFDVLSTPHDLAAARAFLLGAAGSGADRVRLGAFGPLVVTLTHGADQWSIGVCLGAGAGDGSGDDESRFAVNVSRSDLLKALDAARSAAPGPEAQHDPPLADRSSGTAHSLPAARTTPNRWDIRAAADIGRVVRRVVFRWAAPRIAVLADSLSEHDRQRAQMRINKLISSCENHYAGPVLGAVVLLVGGARIASSYIQATTFTGPTGQPWGRIALLLLAAGSAWLAGAALGTIWCRLRLMLALLRLRRRVRRLERAA